MAAEIRPGGDEPPTPYVAVVILHWGPVETTARCLRSLRDVVYQGKRTVLLIDNGGDLDNAVADLAAPLEVEIHRPTHNLGFSGGCIYGMSVAMERGADFVLLLNNDVVVDPLFLDQLVTAANQIENAGLLCPQIVVMGNPGKAWYRGGRFSLWSGIPNQGYWRRAMDAHAPPREVDYATGCAMLIRTALVRRVGFFEPKFFAYCEDLDLSIRAREEGFRIFFVPASVVHHEVTGDPGRQSLGIYYSTRNLIEVMRRHAAWYHWGGFVANFLARWLGFFTALALVRGQPRYVTALARGAMDAAAGRLGKGDRVSDERDGRGASAAAGRAAIRQ
jgi:GT2 family glycosyltransferase